MSRIRIYRLHHSHPCHCPSIPSAASIMVIPTIAPASQPLPLVRPRHCPSIPAITSITIIPSHPPLPQHPSRGHPATTVTVAIINFSSLTDVLVHRMRWTGRDCPPGWGCRPVRRRAWSGISCICLLQPNGLTLLMFPTPLYSLRQSGNDEN